MVIGAAFTAVVDSLTDSFLTTLIGLAGGGGGFGGSVRIAGQVVRWERLPPAR